VRRVGDERDRPGEDARDELDDDEAAIERDADRERTPGNLRGVDMRMRMIMAVAAVIIRMSVLGSVVYVHSLAQSLHRLRK